MEYVLIIVAILQSSAGGWSTEANPVVIKHVFSSQKNCEAAKTAQVDQLIARRVYVNSATCTPN